MNWLYAAIVGYKSCSAYLIGRATILTLPHSIRCQIARHHDFYLPYIANSNISQKRLIKDEYDDECEVHVFYDEYEDDDDQMAEDDDLYSKYADFAQEEVDSPELSEDFWLSPSQK